MPPQHIQFIFDSTPASNPAGSNGDQRSLARAHAARSAHAKARRLRTAQYQAQKAPEDTSDSSSPHYSSESPNSVVSYYRRDPFNSLAKGLNPTEELLLDHYITVIVPAMSCNVVDPTFYTRAMHSWVPHALHEAGLPETLLLASSRHLSGLYSPLHQTQQHQLYTRLTLQYKLQLLASLRESISAETPAFSDTTVIKAIMLAYDEIFVNDQESLKRHVEGAVKMVALKGGPQTLGLDGLVERFLFNLVVKVDPIVRLTVKSQWDPRLSSMEIGLPQHSSPAVEVA
ncbi:hypothetical protein BJX70DRAFT_398871 [Aspergillus crustosus]